MKWGDYPDGPLAAPPEPPKPTKKASLKRYAWSRLHADLPTSDLWNLVADMAGCSRERVEAFVWRLEIYASTNRPRGSVEGFNVKALAASWRCPADDLARIFAALEDVDVMWIEDDVIVTFWERNPDEEDPTGFLRSRKSRKRQKIKQKMLARGAGVADILDEFERQGVAYPQTRIDTRVAVSVTARPDQIKTATGDVDNSGDGAAGEAEAATDKKAAPNGALSTDAEALDAETLDAETWLKTEGARLVTERLGVPTTRATTLIERWRRDLRDDAPAMVAIIAAADRATRTAAHFQVSIGDAIKRHIVKRDVGSSLPLPPVLHGPAAVKPPPSAAPTKASNEGAESVAGDPQAEQERKRSHG
jgi:hypothetical protein